MKTIIIGLGNSVFTDDGAGLLVARALKDKITEPDTMVVEASIAGLDVPDIISDFERAIIVDAIQTPGGEPGTVYRLDIAHLSSLQEGSPHSLDFLTSIQLGKKLGLKLPDQIIVFGIEAQDVSSLNEKCTPRVEMAIPLCIEKILAELITYNIHT